MKCFLVFAIFLPVFFLTGCSSKDIALEANHTTYSYENLRKQDIRLPANYNKNNYRKLLLGVAFSEPGIKAGEISPNIVQTLSSRLQTEMAKLKRFSVFSAHNRGGVTLFQALADVGEAEMPECSLQQLDLVMSAAITVSKEKLERRNDDLIIYEVECDFNCEDVHTKQVKFAEKAKGRTARAVKIGLGGRRVGGYNEDDEKQAIYNAAMKALAVVANKLGNTYPVGGRITGMFEDRMALDKGFEHGVGKDMVMVVYTSIFGVDIPLALAEASPSDVGSSLLVRTWNTKDKDSAKIIRNMRKDPDWFSKHELFAVSYGMARPPEWEIEFKDSFDESLRAR